MYHKLLLSQVSLESISYSHYESDGSMKSDEDIALGIKRAKDVLYNMYRTGTLSQEDYQRYKGYDFKRFPTIE